MSYKLDIQDDLMSIQGLYGTYEASNNEKGGFMIEALGVSLGKAANRCDMISCFVDGDEWVMQEVDDRQRVFEKRGKEEDIVKKVYGNIKLRIRPQK